MEYSSCDVSEKEEVIIDGEQVGDTSGDYVFNL